MKRVFTVLASLGLAVSAFAVTPQPLFPQNMQHPIGLFNSTHKIVTFHIEDQQGDHVQYTKMPDILPALLFNRVTPMWHHNMHVYAVVHHIFKANETLQCQPNNGWYSYVQGYTFVVKTVNNQLVCSYEKI